MNYIETVLAVSKSSLFFFSKNKKKQLNVSFFRFVIFGGAFYKLWYILSVLYLLHFSLVSVSKVQMKHLICYVYVLSMLRVVSQFECICLCVFLESLAKMSNPQKTCFSLCLCVWVVFLYVLCELLCVCVFSGHDLWFCGFFVGTVSILWREMKL